jgi:hypothetical protein
MTLPDKYWETHWEVTAWNTSIDEPYVDFFATEEEAQAQAAELLSEGFAEVAVAAPPAPYPVLRNPTR